MANAPDSTSTTHIYQIILQKYGWERGWQIINDMAGNGKIYGGAVEARSSVVSRETAVALTMGNYGLIAMLENPAVEYIIPENGTQISASPIAYSKVPPHQDAADAFIKFILSQEGQALWLNDTVNRMPIRRDAFDTDYANERDDIDILYNLYNETLSNLSIKFNETLALSFQETMRYHFEATITNVHTKLRSTWADLVGTYQAETINQNRFDEINYYFGKAAINQTEAISYEYNMTIDAAFRDDSQNAWSKFANDKFDFVIEMILNDSLSAPGYQNTSTLEKTTGSIISSTPPYQSNTDLISFNFYFGVICVVLLPILINTKRRH